MKNSKLLKFVLLFTISIFLINTGESQVLINSTGGSPDPSAMLEIQSNSKGLLIPRMTSDQRTSILLPADGLLVYDTDSASFYLSGSSGWVDLSSSAEIWDQNATDVYLSDDTKNIGVGTSFPSGKFVIKADGSKAPDDALFEIQDVLGNPIFVVTSEGARLYVKDYTTTKGVSGGFAVGRYRAAKGMPDTTYFMVTPDSTRIYMHESKLKGVSGGFAVGRYGAAKEDAKLFFTTNENETRVFTNEGLKGVSGGFAVGRYRAAKEDDSLYFYTNPDSTRVYTKDAAKGVSGGFAVGRYGAAKGSAENYMHMTKDNYLIGHSSGKDMTTGLYNLFLGYQAGLENTEGDYNCFVGYQSGSSNIGVDGSDYGHFNTFMGYQSGMSNTSGYYNTFVGFQAGESNTEGRLNCFVGYMAGNSNIGVDGENYGHFNAFFGNEAGKANSSGYFNTFIGQVSGFSNSSGYANTFVGNGSGYYNTTGMRNTIIGSGAGLYNRGNYNTYMGSWTARFSDVGSNNCMLGFSSGQYNDNGSKNTYVGSHSGERVDDGVANVLIGYRAAYTDASTTFSNRLYIANGASVDSTLIYGEFDNHLVGINTRSPLANLHIVGSPTLGSLIISPDASSEDDASLILAEDNDNTFNMSLFYDGSENDLYIYGKSGATTYGPHVTITRSSGDMGLGTPTTVTPGGRLHLYDDVGDVLAIIEADADNNNESDNPRLELRQDGGDVVGAVGFESNTAGAFYTGSIMNSLYLVNDFNSPLQLGTNNTARITIEGGGQVGIGTTTPDYGLQVAGTIAPETDNLYDLGSSTRRWDDVYATNGTIQTSDRRLKENIRILDYGITEIMKLNPVSFTWIKNPEKGIKIGLIAQDVQNIIKETVYEDEEGKTDILGINYSDFIPVLIKGIQEQQDQIELQQSDIEILKKNNEELKQQINELRALINK